MEKVVLDLFEKADSLYDSIIPTQSAIRKNCEEFIKKVLEEAEDNTIDFNDYDVEEWVSVPYDGGNHPEYASDCFSTVHGIYLNNKGEITLDTEDCDSYPISDINWDNVFEVASYIHRVILKES